MIVQPQTDKVFVERYSIETHTDNLNRTKRYVKFARDKRHISYPPYQNLSNIYFGGSARRNIIQKLKVTDTVEVLEEVQVDDIKRDVKLTIDDITPLLILEPSQPLILLVKIQLTNIIDIKDGQVESQEEINDITLLDLFPLR